MTDMTDCLCAHLGVVVDVCQAGRVTAQAWNLEGYLRQTITLLRSKCLSACMHEIIRGWLGLGWRLHERLGKKKSLVGKKSQV